MAFVFLLFFSKETSPLFKDLFWGGDSAIFVILGKLFLEGKIPYVDFFDHKGPTLIYIEALGLLLTGDKTGIFILQVINMSLVLFFVYKITGHFTKSIKDILFLFFTFILFFRFTMVEGNLTEEYGLLYAVISIYITISFYFTKTRLPYIQIVILALCFCIPFWMRPNNAGISSACILFILYVYIKDKKLSEIYRFITILVVFIVLFSAIICFYFIINDAFNDMIYAAFIFNLKYIDSSFTIGRPFILFCIIAFVVSVVFLVGVHIYYKRYKDKGLLVFSIILYIVGFLPLCMKKFYPHYLDLSIPIVLLGILFLMKSWTSWNKLNKMIPVALVLIMATLTISFYTYKYHEVISEEKFVIATNKMLEKIPPENISDVYCYMVLPQIYLISDIKPLHPNFVWQEPHQNSDKALFEKINTALYHKKPSYIMFGEELDDLRNDGLKEMIQEYYIFVEKISIEVKDGKERVLVLYKIKI